MPAWVAKSEFWRGFLRALAADRGRACGSEVNAENGDLEKAAGVFYVCPHAASAYQFDHPQATQRSLCPFFGAWFCGGWASDSDRREAMAALKPARKAQDGIELFRSTANMRRRGHFEARGAVTAGLQTGFGRAQTGQ